MRSEKLRLFFLLLFIPFLITSRGLSCLPWRAGLSLVGVIGAVELHRPQVEHHRLLDVVHHCQTVTVAKHHTGERGQGGGGGTESVGEVEEAGWGQSQRKKDEKAEKIIIVL